MSKKPVKKMTREETRTVFGKVLHVIGNYSLLLFLSVLLAAVSVILQLYIPILFGQAIDYILGPSQVDFAAIAVIMKKTLFFIILASLVTWVMNLINNRLTYRTVADIRAKAIRRIQEVPLSYLDRNSEGDIVQRVIADVDQLSVAQDAGGVDLILPVIAVV